MPPTRITATATPTTAAAIINEHGVRSTPARVAVLAALLAAHEALTPLVRALFQETNPIPVKAALAMMGKIREEYRLPLCPIADENRATLEKMMREYGLI